MASPSLSSSSLGYPPFVTKRLNELQEVEASIESLRAQLVAAEFRRDVIKKELASYKTSRVGAYRFPPELLCNILSLVDEDQVVRNRRLSLVCRLWRNMIESTPQFWNQITIKWTGSPNSFAKIWAYADICLQKSKASPLDVTVDLLDLPAYEEYIYQILRDHFLALRVNPLDFNDGDEVPYSAFYVEYMRFSATTIQRLCEFSKGHTSRWRSFRMNLPSALRESGIQWLFENAEGLYPNLVKLEYRIADDEDQDTIPMTLPFFPSLKWLETDQHLRFDYDCRMVSQIKHIQLCHHASVHFLNNASSLFSALVSLEMDIWGFGGGEHLSERVQFPSLRRLAISGDITERILGLFDTPRLSTLRLAGLKLFGCPIAPLFATLNTLSIEARPPGVLHGATLLESALVQTPRLVSAAISVDPSITADAITKVVDKVRNDGYTLSNLIEIKVTEKEPSLDVQGSALHATELKTLYKIDVSAHCGTSTYD